MRRGGASAANDGTPPASNHLGNPGGVPGGRVSIASPLGSPTRPFRCAFGVRYSAATPVPRLGEPPMAELAYDAVQVPQIDPTLRSPAWDDDQPAPVPLWGRGPAPSLSFVTDEGR